ncbi:MAG TPA: hypothetical protein VMF91_15160 [Bryobacteraceae bacterium]|nr:hypothetical protein [Bryobacteraceae bacterium]
MRILSALVLLIFIAGIGLADPMPPCPSTVTSCTFTVSPGGQGLYQVAFAQNPTPFWETEPVSGWPPVFKGLLSPSELASGKVPYNVEYDFGVLIDLSIPASGQVTVDFQLPPSETNWVAVGYLDNYGGNSATLLTPSGGQTGPPNFAAGPGAAYVLTAVPGELIVSSNGTADNAGDTVFTGMLIGETVPEPQTGWLVLVGTLIAGCASVIRRRRAL